jgi:hypothetical protein
MADFPIPNLQCGFEIFDDNDLPEELYSSRLALVAQQEACSNLSRASANPSAKKEMVFSTGCLYPVPTCRLQTKERLHHGTVI